MSNPNRLLTHFNGYISIHGLCFLFLSLHFRNTDDLINHQNDHSANLEALPSPSLPSQLCNPSLHFSRFPSSSNCRYLTICQMTSTANCGSRSSDALTPNFDTSFLAKSCRPPCLTLLSAWSPIVNTPKEWISE